MCSLNFGARFVILERLQQPSRYFNDSCVRNKNRKLYAGRHNHQKRTMQQDPAQQATPFGVVVPGKPVITTAQSISPVRWIIPVPDAQAVRQVSAQSSILYC
jgi:hypothetical protein